MSRVINRGLGARHVAIVLMALMALMVICVQAQASDDCRLTLSESRIDLGRANQAQFLGAQKDRQGLVLWGQRSLTLSVVCDEKLSLAVAFKGSAVEGDGYRFSRSGQLKLKVIGAQLDGRSVSLRAAGQEGVEQWFRPGERMIAYEGQQVAEGTRLDVQIEVQVWVEPEATTKGRSEELWEGSGRFEMVSAV